MKRFNNRQPQRSKKNTKRTTRGLRRLETLETRALLAADISAWHNQAMPGDVNADGEVSVIDVDTTIAELATLRSNFQASSFAIEGESNLMYLDVNNDGGFTSSDLQTLIESLSIEPEPPAPVTDSVNYDFRILDGNMNLLAGENGTAVLSEGDEFYLEVLVEDTSTTTQGILQAFIDIEFESLVTIASPMDPVVQGPNFIDLNSLDVNEFEAGGSKDKLISVGGLDPRFSSEDNPIMVGGLRQLALVKFTATSVGDVDFTTLFQDYPFDDPDVPSRMIVSLLEEDTDGNPAADGDNFAGTLLRTTSGQEQLEVVTIDGGMVSLTIENNPVFGANNDSYTVNEDFDPAVTPPPPVIEITSNGLTGQYAVLDVLANDLDENLMPAPNRYNITAVNGQTGEVDLTNATVGFYTTSDFPELTGMGFADQILLYQLKPNQNGSDSFTYSIEDSQSGTPDDLLGNVIVTINEIDDLPVAMDMTYVVEVGVPFTLDVIAEGLGKLTGGADESEVLGFGAFDASGVTTGSFSENGSEFTYTSTLSGNTETITYTVTDGNGNTSAPGTISLVTPLDSAFSGMAFFDVNGNGVWDDNAGTNASPEQYIGGLEIGLFDSSGNQVGETVRTDAHGFYEFVEFDAGMYSIQIVDNNDFIHNGAGIILGSGLNAQTQLDNVHFASPGRMADYIGIADFFGSYSENSITLAFAIEGGQATLSWYSVDQGWDRLVNINSDFAIYDPVNKNGQIAFEVDEEEQYVVDAFSTSTPGFVIVAETEHGVILRMDGSQGAVLDNLAEVDALFANM